MTRLPVSLPVNWNYIRDVRQGDWRLMKGDFGEVIVKDYLAGLGIRLERMERRGKGLPDFKVIGKPVMFEVKSHIKGKPGVWQRKSFMPLARLGWKIIVAQPDIRREKGNARVRCSRITWYFFNASGRLERIERCPWLLGTQATQAQVEQGKHAEASPRSRAIPCPCL